MDISRVSDDAMKALTSYDWPGNIRELQSVLKKAVLNATGPLLLAEFLPDLVRGAPPDDGPTEPCSDAGHETDDWGRFVDDRVAADTIALYDETIERMERWLLSRILRRTSGNQVQAAKILGITRTTLRSKLGKLGLTIEKVVEARE